MPLKPRKVRMRSGSVLTGRQIEHLLRGWCLAVCTEFGNIHYPFRDDDHRRQLWFENKDYLLGLSGRVKGVFGEIKKGDKPRAMIDYEKNNKK